MPSTHSYKRNSIAFCVVYQGMWLIMQCMNVRYGFNFILTPFAGMLMCLCRIRLASTSELAHLPGSHIRFMVLQRFLFFFFPTYSFSVDVRRISFGLCVVLFFFHRSRRRRLWHLLLLPYERYTILRFYYAPCVRFVCNRNGLTHMCTRAKKQNNRTERKIPPHTHRAPTVHWKVHRLLVL